MNNVIARYHKFVKPAFDEYIRPTRKMADVIIPRGAENYVAIDLVAQHLKYQISKMFSDKNISLEKPLKAIEIFPNDIIDPKWQFISEKIKVPQNEDTIEVLLNIFQDFLNGRNIIYYKMFLEQLISSLFSLLSESINIIPGENYSIITELDLQSSLNISNKKTIIYFQTFVLIEDDHNVLK